MKSLVELQSEIKSLQAKAAQLKSREFDRTIRQIVETMAAFGISLSHLKAALGKGPAKGSATRGGKARVGRPGRPTASAVKPSRKAKAAPQAATRRPAKIKFRGPAGEAWSGRGKTPTWLRALVEAGRKVDEFRI
jgi:DNA-binding protein H-NS